MMTIGEFALQSGLSVKTLRFYDERGLLPPAEVDPGSGYRRYTAGQLRHATMIRVLRATGMSLDVLSQALAEPDRWTHLLAAHRSRLEVEREFQDRALRIAQRLLSDAEKVTPVLTREADPTRWAAIAVTVDVEDDTEQDAEWANAHFAQLWQALTDGGNRPVGPFWTSMCPSSATGMVELLLSWPVALPVPDSFVVHGADVRRGTLPKRTEAYIRIDVRDTEEEDLLDGDANGRLLHPAYIALAEFLEHHGQEPAQIRQVGVLSEDGSPIAMDLTATLSTNPAVDSLQGSL